MVWTHFIHTSSEKEKNGKIFDAVKNALTNLNLKVVHFTLINLYLAGNTTSIQRFYLKALFLAYPRVRSMTEVLSLSVSLSFCLQILFIPSTL